jgi:hypothetical protein
MNEKDIYDHLCAYSDQHHGSLPGSHMTHIVITLRESDDKVVFGTAVVDPELPNGPMNNIERCALSVAHQAARSFHHNIAPHIDTLLDTCIQTRQLRHLLGAKKFNEIMTNKPTNEVIQEAVKAALVARGIADVLDEDTVVTVELTDEERLNAEVS